MKVRTTTGFNSLGELLKFLQSLEPDELKQPVLVRETCDDFEVKEVDRFSVLAEKEVDHSVSPEREYPAGTIILW